MTLETAACDYFLLISKLEYALKNCGFVTPYKDDSAKPDWTKFINTVHENVNLNTQDSDVHKFLEEPLKKQLYNKQNNNLSWSEPQGIGAQNKKAALQACLTIRNNLFHGGKNADGNTGRNEYLLRAATQILTSAIEACPEVKEKFDQAKL